MEQLYICFAKIDGAPVIDRGFYNYCSDIARMFANNPAQHVELLFVKKEVKETYSATIANVGQQKNKNYNEFNSELRWKMYRVHLKHADIQEVYRFCKDYSNYDYNYMSLFTIGCAFNSPNTFSCNSYCSQALLASPQLTALVPENQANSLKKEANPQKLYTLVSKHPNVFKKCELTYTYNNQVFNPNTRYDKRVNISSALYFQNTPVGSSKETG